MIWARGTVTKSWVGFRMELTREGKVISLGRETGTTPPAKFRLVPARTDQELSRTVANHVENLRRNGLFNGAIVITRRGRTVFASEGQWTPYPIASISKVFAGVLLAQLEGEGRLSLGDTVAKWLPEYPQNVARHVTIRDLLAHTSGIELDEIPEFNVDVGQARTVEDMVAAQIKHLPKLQGFSDFKKPTQFDYTNEGYALVARIAEVTAAKPYWAMVEARILKPAGIRLDQGAAPDGSTYVDPDGSFRSQPRSRAWDAHAFPSPSGGLVMCARDLARFAHMLFDGKYVPLDLVSQQLATVAPGRGYGYGVYIEDTFRGRMIGHGGDVLGYSAQLAHFPKSQYTIVVLCNRDFEAAALSRAVMEWLPNL